MKKALVITAILMSWFVYMDGSVFAGPFDTYRSCSLVANFLNANFDQYFACH